jgi:hypothetical protein
VKPRLKSLEPQSYGKCRGSSVRKRRWGGGGWARIGAGNRIKAPPAERIAAQHAPYCERASPEQTSVDDSGHGVFRACRLKSACPGDPTDGVKQWRDPAAISFRNAHPASPRPSQRQQRSWILRSASRRIPQSEPFAADAAQHRHRASAKPGSSEPLRACAA